MIHKTWDVIVIGAGPAGSVAANELARLGKEVLLVDKSLFPREKVCGSCLSYRALYVLNQLGFPTDELNGHPLDEFNLRHDGKALTLPLSGAISISRKKLDQWLVDQAIKNGATFLDGTQASLESSDSEKCVVRINEHQIQARIILVCDGIGGTSLGKMNPVSISNHSRIGLSGILEYSGLKPNRIYMAVAKEGYVGMVRLEDGRLNLAAAVDPKLVKIKKPKEAIGHILNEAGFDFIPQLDQVHGTPLLTRKRKTLAGPRFFVIGDAAGYTEPFTGEGMTWAIESARAVVPFVNEALNEWNFSIADRWEKTYKSIFSKRTLFCRLLTLSLRQTAFTQIGIRILTQKPEWAKPLLNLVSATQKADPSFGGQGDLVS